MRAPLYCPECGAPATSAHAVGCRWYTKPEPERPGALASYRARERARHWRHMAAYHLGRRRRAMRRARELAQSVSAFDIERLRSAVRLARRCNGARVRCLLSARAEEVKSK